MSQISVDDHLVVTGDIAWADDDFNHIVDAYNNAFLDIEYNMDGWLSGPDFEQNAKDKVYGPGQDSCESMYLKLCEMVETDQYGTVLNPFTLTVYPRMERLLYTAQDYLDPGLQSVMDPSTGTTTEGYTLTYVESVLDKQCTLPGDQGKVLDLGGNQLNYYSLAAYSDSTETHLGTDDHPSEPDGSQSVLKTMAKVLFDLLSVQKTTSIHS